jgi:hypothetical protein
MAQNFSTGTTVENNLLPNLTPTNPSKTGMLFSQRTLNANNQLILPQGSMPMPCLYKPIYLAPYTNGIQALLQMGKMGFKYTLGLNFDDTFVKPDTVTINNLTGITTLTWFSATIGVQFLVSNNPKGTVVQGTANGTIRGVDVSDGKSYIYVVPTTGSTAFNALNPVVVSAILDKELPNPKTSDKVCCQVWAYYQQYVTLPQYATSPDLNISVSVATVDSSISPSSTPVALVKPTAVVVEPDGSVTLTYPLTAFQLGLLPSEALGYTIVTQSPSNATGTYNGYTLDSQSCNINVVNVTGTFNTTDAITVAKDITQNGFAFLGSLEVSTYCLGWNIPNYQYLLNNFPDYVAGIQALQAVEQTKFNKFVPQGCIGLSFTTANQYPLSSIVAPDTKAYLYAVNQTPSKAFEFPITGDIIAVANMYMNLNNDAPYYNTSGEGIILNLAIPADPNAVTNANQLTSQGLTVFLPNTTGLAYPYNNVNCLQTNSGLVDLEYRFQSAMQKVRWLNRNQVLISEATLRNANGTRKNNSPDTIASVTTNLTALLTQASSAPLSMFGTANNSVTVVIDPVDVTRLITTVNTSITPANNGNQIINYFYSYTS